MTLGDVERELGRELLPHEILIAERLLHFRRPAAKIAQLLEDVEPPEQARDEDLAVSRFEPDGRDGARRC